MNYSECLNCGAAMEPGFALDRWGERRHTAMVWVSGSFWSFALGRERTLPITVYRCRSCGLLQSYATPAGEAKVVAGL